jgi:RNA polymerase sigma-70 factor (ECF subfamily)
MGCNPEIIIEKYSDLVYKICMTKLYNFDRSSVADACQNVFLNYLKEKREFKNDEHEKAWFIRTAINCCTDIYRKDKRRFLNEENADISEINIAVSNDFESFEDDSLYEILALLPEKISSAVYLFYIEEYSTEEIAEILKTSGASIRMRLKRGREILKKKIEQKNFLIRNSEEGVLDA